MIESISMIFGVAASLLSTALSLKNVQREKRIRASEFFTDVADTLDNAVEKLKVNEVPHGACEQMRQYALNIKEILDGIVDPFDATRYSHELYHAHEIERLLIDVQNNPDGLKKLEIAAGNFRAVATIFKVKN